MMGVSFNSLLQAPERFQFYQFCRLLQQAGVNLRVPGLQTEAEEVLQFNSWPYLGFPAAELKRALPEAVYHYRLPVVYTTFMGLIGTDGVLPGWLIAAAAEKSDAAARLSAFLDMFHHRQMALFYQVWKRYRYEFQYLAGGEDRISQALLTLVQGQRRPQVAVPYYLGVLRLLNKRHKNAFGLSELVRYVVPAALRVQIRPFVPVTHAVPPVALGQGLMLGQAVLGRFTYDANSCIGIQVTLGQYAALGTLYAGQQVRLILAALVRKYLGLGLDVLLSVCISSACIPVGRLDAVRPVRLAAGIKSGEAADETMMMISLGKL